ncbi:Glu-tRNA(Gln) amidotransferase subunit GatD [Candidatus Bathyarchaeota archaeon]|nr:MAG: Glu-tRNA(Gln) amidotransferase subunit GatD [Candidatus Bathyarchaeota archaeon]
MTARTCQSVSHKHTLNQFRRNPQRRYESLSRTELEGYQGQILHHLQGAGAKVGSIIRVTSKDGEVFEGALFPRSEYADQNHICLKMKNGYNIGIHLERAEKIEVIGEGEKPHFTKPKVTTIHEVLPKVSLVSIGGTIASRVDYRTGAVQPALTAEDLTSVVPELGSIAEIDAHILYSELSENLTTAHWQKIAEETARLIRGGADGVIIAHGTDTMHYTSAALSFALQDLPVPVLIVGAQRSSDRPSSDAASNLTGGVAIAARADIASVGVAMHSDMSDRFIVAHRGTRVRKCHTSRRDAFRSINSPFLARYDVANGARGIVLEGTGLGHVSRQCYEPINRAVKQDVPIFMTSQTIWGRVDMNVYSTGRDLVDIGVVPLEDMLSETALVKLMWALSQTKSRDKIRETMLHPVAGEVTERTLAEAS